MYYYALRMLDKPLILHKINLLNVIKKRQKKIFITYVFLLATLAALAQGKQMKGIVKDSAGEPIIGATVAEVGNNKNATVTDLNGQKPVLRMHHL